MPHLLERVLTPAWVRSAGRTVRLRLTILYGVLFLAGGAGLLAITYAVVDRFSTSRVAVSLGPHTGGGAGAPTVYRGSGPIPPDLAKHLSPAEIHRIQQLGAQASAQRAADLHQLLVGSGIALGVMAVIAVAVAWVVAGRVLRPLRAMTTATQQISARNLHERLALPGPRDELRALADTIDGLLGRLQGAFDSQRHFVANAAHELRTPLTLERAVLEVALANPDASEASLRTACQKAIAASEQHEHLIESLLTLATSERGLERTEPVDLAAAADAVLLAPHPDIEAQHLDVTATIRPAPTVGDPRLLERLIANLLDNATRYNHRYGVIRIATGATGTGAWVAVANSGPVVPAEDIDRLLGPFQRLEYGDGGGTVGVGLGLSIVAAIAAAHDAHLDARPQPAGGLEVTVTFPLAPTAPGAAPAADVAHREEAPQPAGGVRR